MADNPSFRFLPTQVCRIAANPPPDDGRILLLRTAKAAISRRFGEAARPCGSKSAQDKAVRHDRFRPLRLQPAKQFASTVDKPHAVELISFVENRPLAKNNGGIRPANGDNRIRGH